MSQSRSPLPKKRAPIRAPVHLDIRRGGAISRPGISAPPRAGRAWRGGIVQQRKPASFRSARFDGRRHAVPAFPRWLEPVVRTTVAAWPPVYFEEGPANNFALMPHISTVGFLATLSALGVRVRASPTRACP